MPRKVHVLVGVALLVLLVFCVNARLLGVGVLCKDEARQLLAAKDRTVQKAMQQMQEALSQQEVALNKLREEREASRDLRKRLEKLGALPRRRRSQHDGDGADGVNVPVVNAGTPSAADAPAPDMGDAESHEFGGGSRGAAVASTMSKAAATSVSSSPLVPSAIAVVVIAYNRAQYLDRALKSIYRSHPGGEAFPVYVSQDGPNAEVSQVAAKHGARSLIHPRRRLELKRGSYLAKMPGYAYLSVHYGWALRTLFGMGSAPGEEGAASLGAANGQFAGVIILEEVGILPRACACAWAWACILPRAWGMCIPEERRCCCMRMRHVHWRWHARGAPRHRRPLAVLSTGACARAPILGTRRTSRCRRTSSRTSRRPLSCSTPNPACCASRRSTTTARGSMQGTRRRYIARTSSRDWCANAACREHCMRVGMGRCWCNT